MENLRQEITRQTGYTLNEIQMTHFLTYERELLDWNQRFNLTAVRDSQGVQIKHFLDSLTCLLAFGDSIPNRLVDIGTGAGFPGIPLKIIFPQMQLTLVESVGKKAQFCRHIVQTLKFDKTEILTYRAEEMGQMPIHREKYDCAVARAVANLPILAEYLLPLVKVGGLMLAQKGENGPAEVHSAEGPIKILGGSMQKIKEVHLPGVTETRYLISIKKVAATPPAYPRRVGIPSKSPLK
ncbi:MAG: 16S rRNA (guanine(527)-N(7))-methyltransferase RsmG [Anaerolineae bacterium]|nr:16S rRNA (guanine(527)-N(7))-methyltransferase RsmG [Anaerolineae bacterium]